MLFFGSLNSLYACARGRGDRDGLNRAFVETVMAYTDKNGGARELKARPWQLQYVELEALT